MPMQGAGSGGCFEASFDGWASLDSSFEAPCSCCLASSFDGSSSAACCLASSFDGSSSAAFCLDSSFDGSSSAACCLDSSYDGSASGCWSGSIGTTRSIRTVLE